MQLKHGLLLGLGASVALAAVVAGCTTTNTTSAPLPATTVEQYVERGRYLADVGECISCHTTFGAKGPDVENHLFEGGNAWVTPNLGIGIAPNLTPYEGSYVKDLSVDELVAKLKDVSGVGPNGLLKLLPPMPVLAKYKDDDLKAIAYYLKSVPAKPSAANVAKTYFFPAIAGNPASPSLKTQWPQPKLPGGATVSHGPVIPGGIEAPPSFDFDQATIDKNLAGTWPN